MKQAAETEVDREAEAYAYLKGRQAELAECDSLIAAFKKEHTAVIDGRVAYVVASPRERRDLDRRSLCLSQARGRAVQAFNKALESWSQIKTQTR
jgi:hypothetical protein